MKRTSPSSRATAARLTSRHGTGNLCTTPSHGRAAVDCLVRLWEDLRLVSLVSPDSNPAAGDGTVYAQTPAQSFKCSCAVGKPRWTHCLLWGVNLSAAGTRVYQVNPRSQSGRSSIDGRQLLQLVEPLCAARLNCDRRYQRQDNSLCRNQPNHAISNRPIYSDYPTLGRQRTRSRTTVGVPAEWQYVPYWYRPVCAQILASLSAEPDRSSPEEPQQKTGVPSIDHEPSRAWVKSLSKATFTAFTEAHVCLGWVQIGGMAIMRVACAILIAVAALQCLMVAQQDQLKGQNRNTGRSTAIPTTDSRSTFRFDLNGSGSACTLCYHAGMRKQASLVQYTVRGVPREVDIVLRRKAAKRKLSLNQMIVEQLSEAAIGARSRADFSDLVGKWTPDAAFDAILAAGRKIDRDKWK